MERKREKRRRRRRKGCEPTLVNGRRGGFINIKDMYNNDGGQGGARVCETHEVKKKVALVRVPFYFIISWLITERHRYCTCTYYCGEPDGGHSAQHCVGVVHCLQSCVQRRKKNHRKKTKHRTPQSTASHAHAQPRSKGEEMPAKTTLERGE
jgi:hypothetical protein